MMQFHLTCDGECCVATAGHSDGIASNAPVGAGVAASARARRAGTAVDVLVNNAGINILRPIAEIDEATWSTMLQVNLTSVLRLTQTFAPAMAARGWGRIINISGLAARQTGSIIGSIRNVALAAFTKNLAEELGITEHNRAKPVEASVTSAVSFVLGGAMPVLAVAIGNSTASRIWITLIVSIGALVALGSAGAHYGRASKRVSVRRVVIGGIIAMGFTMLVGKLFGAAVN